MSGRLGRTRGRLIQLADPIANLTKFAYNSNGLVTQMTDPRNQITQFNYSLADLASITDPLGRTTTFFTDPLGRVVELTRFGGDLILCRGGSPRWQRPDRRTLPHSESS